MITIEMKKTGADKDYLVAEATETVEIPNARNKGAHRFISFMEDGEIVLSSYSLPIVVDGGMLPREKSAGQALVGDEILVRDENGAERVYRITMARYENPKLELAE